MSYLLFAGSVYYPSGGWDDLIGVFGDHGAFGYVGYWGFWWSSTESDTGLAWDRVINYNNSYITRGTYYKPLGCSVRCVKDS